MSDYVTMFQNDTEQISQVLREYEQEKGLAHGVQKDAIQNGFGARKRNSAAKACQGEWAFHFELKNINNKPALVFWDEGTTGLTGDILSSEEIEERSASETLGPDQKLGRFLSRFQSGENTGPGSFGRGKLIFQAASQQHSILIDSLRDDSRYIALDRKLIKNQLKQPAIPYVDEEAQKFITEKTGGSLNPLQSHGTRITVLDVNEEIIDAINMSFESPARRDNSASFFYMIAETWWEIIQMGAKIYVKNDANEIQVTLEGILRDILEAKNEVSGHRVFVRKNIPVTVNSSTHQIKELKLILSPQNIDEELREIWVQRKRMKIGGVDRRINKHHKIQKRLSGYLRLDSKLETLFEQAEGTTHYGFDMRRTALQQVKDIVGSKVEEFQRELGYREENTKGRLQNELNAALKEINSMAGDLGLPTEFGRGKKKKEVSISIMELILPDINTTRIELNDYIGPIKYRIKNQGSSPANGQLILTCEQGNTINHEVFSQTVVVQPDDDVFVEVPAFKIDQTDYNAGSMLLIRARLKKSDINAFYGQVTRSLWIGKDPPVSNDLDVDISLQRPKFPRKDSSRVELGEVIEGLGFTLSNKSNISLNLNIDVKVRKCKTQNSDVLDLVTLYTAKGYTLEAMADGEFDLSDINISSELFGRIFAEPNETRKCEVFFSVRFAETYEYLERVKGDYAAAKKSILFYCGVDPDGQSIFKNNETVHDPSDSRRAYVNGDRTQGYTFVINTGHAAYKYVESQGTEIRESYFQEQMIFHAARLAVRNKIFEGPLADFSNEFEDETMSPDESALIIDKVVGCILSKFRG